MRRGGGSEGHRRHPRGTETIAGEAAGLCLVGAVREKQGGKATVVARLLGSTGCRQHEEKYGILKAFVCAWVSSLATWCVNPLGIFVEPFSILPTWHEGLEMPFQAGEE